MSASAGRVMMIPRGDYSASQTYNILDVVSYNGSSYVAKRTTVGNAPTDTTYWQPLADISAKMDKSVYDSNNNGIVDNAEKVNDHTVEKDVPADAQFTDTKTLSGLTDTDINNPTQGQALLYNFETEKFENQDISSGGSYITLTTTTEQGENVSMSIGGATYTGTFSSEGVCRFEGVKETGTATISTARVTTTLVIEYYGSYVAVVDYVPAHIYGVEWDGTATTVWSRTDESADFVDPVPYQYNITTYSSPFDDLMPWAGMVKEERTGGTMVKIPKFWYKITQNGTGLKIQIADGNTDGFSVSPAHMDRGDGKGERDYIYVGRYHCGATDYKSASGQLPKVSITRSEARNAIHNLGTNIWQMDFATRFTIWLLYLVEFAEWNSQNKLAYGGGNKQNMVAMGYTDSMPYHTGTTMQGRFTYGASVQYRHIEGLWENAFDWLDGCRNDSSGFNIILNPSNFSDSSGGVLVGRPSSGYPTAFSVEDVSGAYPIFIPTAAGGSDSTYSCDSWDFGSSGECLISGGDYYQSKTYGLFNIGFSASGSTYTNRSCRIMELP